jgi:hypothetical protein
MLGRREETDHAKRLPCASILLGRVESRPNGRHPRSCKKPEVSPGSWGAKVLDDARETAPGTVNREQAVLSHLFSKAVDWGWISHRQRSCRD